MRGRTAELRLTPYTTAKSVFLTLNQGDRAYIWTLLLCERLFSVQQTLNVKLLHLLIKHSGWKTGGVKY